ncbi:MAG: hypothetical protein DRJ03_24555 [Chloroflexi bacterium]|nr:MAG: hypothetical protein DRJ03_24555 [Chloroflexota bacterium]
MFVLVMGAKGGVGTTSVALHLARRAARGIGLDLTADGQLAARLSRPTWTLSDAALRSAQQQRMVDQVVKQSVSLLWTPVCALPNISVAAWDFVRAVAARATVVADGGIEPLEEAARLADVTVIVSAESDVARYHAQRLGRRFPNAQVLELDLSQSRNETRDAARELAARLFE